MPKALWVTPLALLLNGGCYPLAAAKVPPQLEAAQELAVAIYRDRKTDLGPPNRQHIGRVKQFGQGRLMWFLANGKVAHWHAPNLPAYIYTIGWFGYLWDLEFVASHLSHTDPEVKQSALFAFSRLTARPFPDAAKAAAWWQGHGEEFPSRLSAQRPKE